MAAVDIYKNLFNNDDDASLIRNRLLHKLPVIIRRNLRFLGALLMMKLNFCLCYGAVTNRPEYVRPWIYVQMILQLLDFGIWMVEVLQKQIEFKWITCRNFLIMACNLHVINTFKICLQFAIATKRLL